MLVWLKLSLSLADTPLHLDWEKLCVHLDLANLSQLLKNLEDQKMFKIAYEFARLAHLPIDHVLVAEVIENLFIIITLNIFLFELIHSLLS